jgi:hypothetical protein
MPILKGLPGVKAAQLEAPDFNTVTQAMRNLTTHRATTTAADNGAINLWIDDAGVYRGERYRLMSTKSSISCSKKKPLRDWLVENLPKIV